MCERVCVMRRLGGVCWSWFRVGAGCGADTVLHLAFFGCVALWRVAVFVAAPVCFGWIKMWRGGVFGGCAGCLGEGEFFRRIGGYWLLVWLVDRMNLFMRKQMHLR